MPPIPRSARTAPTSDGGIPLPDPRVNAWRADLADIALRGRVDAPRYAAPVAHRLTAPAPHTMRLSPAADAVAVSELLPGERFDVIDIAGGWAWGFSATDHYVGYVEADVLGEGALAAAHRVAVPLALAFAAPDIKTPVRRLLPLNAPVAAQPAGEKFLRTAEGDYVHRRHLADVGCVADDPVAVAMSFAGTPYRWGGRTRLGIDCSGLVQTALHACGIACPRDSDMQALTLGDAADGELRRGDIVFFPGHVGIMVDGKQLLHANAFHMSTLVESLADVVARLAPDHAEPVTAVRRL